MSILLLAAATLAMSGPTEPDEMSGGYDPIIGLPSPMLASPGFNWPPTIPPPPGPAQTIIDLPVGSEGEIPTGMSEVRYELTAEVITIVNNVVTVHPLETGQSMAISQIAPLNQPLSVMMSAAIPNPVCQFTVYPNSPSYGDVMHGTMAKVTFNGLSGKAVRLILRRKGTEPPYFKWEDRVRYVVP